MTEREKLEAVAQSSRDLFALMKTQKTTMAVMLRACVKQLRSPDSRKRGEAIKAVEDLASMLEKGV